MTDQRRRYFLQRAIGLIPIVYFAPALLQQARAAASCVDPDSESLRTSMHYVAKSSDANKECGTCGFFTPSDPKSCGECQIMSGPVDFTGHCDSWSPKS